MTSLGTLKLTATQKPVQQSQTQQRRNKLAKRLWEQIELARAQATGSVYAPIKFKTITSADGVRRQVEQQKRVKQWWFVADSGKLALSVRYGTKLLELAKGKWAVEVGTDKDLVSVLEGELDAQIDAAANKLRAGFIK